MIACVVVAGAAAAQAQPAAEAPPRDVREAAALLAAAPAATLRRGDLRVTVAVPDARTGFYRGTRFDWAGMITDVTLGGSRFYGPWFDGVAPNVHDFAYAGDRVIAGPQTAATGPAEEFVGPAGDPALGYAAAPAGGTFVKIGVGRLRKVDDAPYDHFRSYPLVAGADRWTVQRAADRISFRQRLPADRSGYGYDYEKTVRLEPGNVVVIAHTLRNTGSRPIATQVYNHNFARFDGREIGPDVRVRFPYPLAAQPSPPELAAVDGAEMRYLRPLTGKDRVTLAVEGFTTDPATSGFTVQGGLAGARIRTQADVPLARSTLWSMRRVVAVEPYIALDLAPGASRSWTWRYTYEAGQAPR